MLFEKQIEYFEKNQYGQQYKIFYKKTVKHFSLSNPADRHSFPERYDILSGKFLENYFFKLKMKHGHVLTRWDLRNCCGDS